MTRSQLYMFGFSLSFSLFNAFMGIFELVTKSYGFAVMFLTLSAFMFSLFYTQLNRIMVMFSSLKNPHDIMVQLIAAKEHIDSGRVVAFFQTGTYINSLVYSEESSTKIRTEFEKRATSE